ncbi:hypothetical protein IEQ34_009714 [Dendrobium chrysotoxum]|uniref:RING-type E3 ubiquitin transferase n=1 Tax=Dendrobium chrysotoxum TaxID=161865 RepID=A0AAV7H349_DENCH|nr:hypothetical protein IEQ34_009714 [Dendrobium chrysotoxum]
MESGFWVQQRLDDTLLLTHISVPTGYVYTPWMRSVPAPWMMHSFSARWTMRSVPTPWMHSTGPRRYRYELPPRMRSSNTNTTRIHSTAADINERAPEQQQNPQNQSSRAGNRLSEERISNFLINSLGRLTTTEENIICTICQEEINVKEKIAILRCNHIYHVGCIKNWLMIKNECAVCRARAIPDENVRRVLC